jgi:peptidoglycan/LPS O-acetylase OafA/YrhL
LLYKGDLGMSNPTVIQNQTPRKVSSFRYYPQLDGLRAVAILCVLIEHELTRSLHIPGWENFGSLGVMLFFVLSGFLITGLLCKEEINTGNIDLKAFYMRRALRIFPAFFALIAVVSILVSVGLVNDTSWKTILICCFYLRNIWGDGGTLGHTWSLSLEEQFYIFWPPVLKRLDQQKALGFAIGTTALIMLWRTFVLFTHPEYNPAFVGRPEVRFDSMLIGCCIALYLSQRSLNASILKKVTSFFNPAWIFPTLIFWTLFGTVLPYGGPFYFTIQMFLAAALLLHLIIMDKSTLSIGLSHPWLIYIGKLSYSIYLWQQIFIFSKDPDWGWVRIFPMDLILSVAAGVASYYLVERPFLKLKDMPAFARTSQ